MSAFSQPIVEMLWESDDPHHELTRRFKFPDTQAASNWLRQALRDHWSLNMDSCTRIVISAGNALAWVVADGRKLILKWSIVSVFFPKLRAVSKLTHWLSRQGVPVVPPIPTLDGSLQVDIDGVSANLIEVVEGDLLDGSDPEQVYAAGAALAELHQKLAEYPDVEAISLLQSNEPPLLVLTDRVKHWLDEQESAYCSEVAYLRSAIDGLASKPFNATQLVHNDFRSANLLYAGSKLTAVLDFEEVVADYRIVDLAKAATRLGTKYRNWGPIEPAIRASFVSGYQSVSTLSESELAWFGPLVLWNSLQAASPGEVYPWAHSAMSTIRDHSN